MLNTWSESNVQNFSIGASSDFVLGEPIEVSSIVEQADGSLPTLPGDVSANSSQDASA